MIWKYLTKRGKRNSYRIQGTSAVIPLSSLVNFAPLPFSVFHISPFLYFWFIALCLRVVGSNPNQDLNFMYHFWATAGPHFVRGWKDWNTGWCAEQLFPPRETSHSSGPCQDLGVLHSPLKMHIVLTQDFLPFLHLPLFIFLFFTSSAQYLIFSPLFPLLFCLPNLLHASAPALHHVSGLWHLFAGSLDPGTCQVACCCQPIYKRGKNYCEVKAHILLWLW